MQWLMCVFCLVSGMKRDFDGEDDGGYRQKRRRDQGGDGRQELRVLLQSKVRCHT